MLLSPFVLTLSGCGPVERIKAAEYGTQLSDTTRTYSKAIRWSEFEAARQFLRRQPEVADAPPRPAGARVRPGSTVKLSPITRDLSKIKVTKARIIQQVVSKDGLDAEVGMEVEYFHDDLRNVTKIIDIQHWWYDQEIGRWFLDGDIPDFYGRMSR
jgi:hypothetical protein